MGHTVTVPVVCNGKDKAPTWGSTHSVFNPMIAGPGGDPLEGEGQFRTLSCDFGTWDAAAVALVLGYLANIWSKVQHPGYPDQVDIPLRGITGSGSFDLSAHADKYPNFQVSRATVIITDYPAGADLIFAPDNVIKGGYFSFMAGGGAGFDKDWLPVAPLKVDPAQQISFAAGASLNGPYIPGPPLPQSYNTWDIHGDYARVNPFDPSATVYGSVAAVAGAFTIAWHAKNPPAPVSFIKGSLSKQPEDLFPLEWINHMRSTFVPREPNVNGIWWYLNPGVTADIQIYGTTREPGVEATQNVNPVN
jgi:hypothetical protein